MIWPAGADFFCARAVLVSEKPVAMMKTMKRCLCLLPLAGALACAADLAGVHAVYLLPMARGMDQYLANQLTNEHIFRVVTDPKLADAIFTDHVSEGFQMQLEDFSPTPKPPAPAKPASRSLPPKPATSQRRRHKPAGSEPAAKADDEAAPPAKPGRSESQRPSRAMSHRRRACWGRRKTR